jgi:sulfate/thiosulfate transport system ATP-binding protein
MIRLENLTKKFGKRLVLNDINIDIKRGELIALLGPSGSGKTTLLRTISGLESINSGKIFLDDIDATNLPITKRKIGFVFQNYALFNHMTVFDNVAFGLNVNQSEHKMSKQEITDKVTELLHYVHLENFANYYPTKLSGGQRQRVALVRALANDQDILLLDEPFGALDSKVRKELRTWLRQLHEQSPITSIFVTHDLDEALEIADRIVIMSEGVIIQTGTSEEIYKNPVNEFVYDFFGDYNCVEVRIENNIAYFFNDSSKKTENIVDKIYKYINIWGKKLNTSIKNNKQTTEQYRNIYFRPHDIEITKGNIKSKQYLKVKIKRIYKIANIIKIETSSFVSGQHILIEIAENDYNLISLVTGEYIYIKPKIYRVF